MNLKNIINFIATKLILLKDEKLYIFFIIISVLPFLFIAFYNHPTDDDFCLAVGVRNLGAINYLKELLYSHTGRYTSVLIIILLNPLSSIANGFFWVKVLAIFIQITTLLCFLFFAYNLLKNYVPYKNILIVSFIVYICFISNIPSISSFFFWFTGTSAYTYGLNFLFLTMAFYILWIKQKKTRWLVVANLCMVLTIGVNEIFIVIIGSLFIGIFILKSYGFKKYSLWITFLIFIICSQLSLSSTGNFTRMNELHPNQSLHDIQWITAGFKTLIMLVNVLLEWISDLKIYLAALLLFLLLDWERVFVRINGMKMCLFMLLTFSMLFGINFLSILAVNDFLPRILNISYFVFLVSFFFLFTFISKIYTTKFPKLYTGSLLKKSMIFLFFALILLSGNSNVWIAYSDLLFKVSDFNKKMNNRYLMIAEGREANLKLILVPPAFDEIYEIPKTLFLSDITTNRFSYPNNCYAEYFCIEEIELEKQYSLPPFHLRSNW
jgi:hypothetical protein